MSRTQINHEIPGLRRLATSHNDMVRSYASNGFFLIVMPGAEFIINEPQIYAGIILHSDSKLIMNAAVGSDKFPVLFCNIDEKAQIEGVGVLHCAEASGYNFEKASLGSSRVIKEVTPAIIQEWWDVNVVSAVDSERMISEAHATLPMALLSFVGYDFERTEELNDTPFDKAWGKYDYSSDDESLEKLIGGFKAGE